jgi:hypothetical protein
VGGAQAFIFPAKHVGAGDMIAEDNTETKVADRMNAQLELGLAITRVMADLKRLEKLHTNNHGGYMFASIDDFKDEVRPLMAKHGLYVNSTEKTFEIIPLKVGKNEEKPHVKIKYRFRLFHVNGEASPASSVTVVMPYTGAQTIGAAQSYALKETIYKSQFQASSGDMNEEADLQIQTNLANTVERLSKAEARPLEEALRKEMNEVVTVDRSSKALANWWKDNRDNLAMLPLDWFAMIKKDCADEGRKLQANEEADKKNAALI